MLTPRRHLEMLGDSLVITAYVGCGGGGGWYYWCLVIEVKDVAKHLTMHKVTSLNKE